MLSHYMSKTFLSILAVPNKTDFCTIPTFSLIPSVSIHPLKPLLVLPRTPKTAGKTSTFFSNQSLFSSLFKFWYFKSFRFHSHISYNHLSYNHVSTILLSSSSSSLSSESNTRNLRTIRDGPLIIWLDPYKYLQGESNNTNV